jgi:uncharacterized membrane protein YGL010W
VGNSQKRMKWLRLVRLFALAAVIVLGCRFVLDWLSAMLPGKEAWVNGGVGLVFVCLIVVFVMKPLFEDFGIVQYKPGISPTRDADD